MSKLRFLKLATVLAAIPLATVGCPANADPPAPGDTCAVLQATTQDANGRTMYCSPAKAGDQRLVWQYGILVSPSPPVSG